MHKSNVGQFPLAIPDSMKTGRWVDLIKQSAQLAQCAARRGRTALHNPRPPLFEGIDTATAGCPSGSPKSVAKHCHTLLSCCSANCAVSSGLTMRNQKLALVAPQKKSNNQADCKSGTVDPLKQQSLLSGFCV